MPSEHYGPRRMAALDFYGIDPESDEAGIELEQARVADMERLGFEARLCVRCRKAYPTMFDCGAICPGCHDLITKRDAPLKRHIGRGLIKHNRVADGLGCTERVPDWTTHLGGWS